MVVCQTRGGSPGVVKKSYCFFKSIFQGSLAKDHTFTQFFFQTSSLICTKKEILNKKFLNEGGRRRGSKAVWTENSSILPKTIAPNWLVSSYQHKCSAATRACAVAQNSIAMKLQNLKKNCDTLLQWICKNKIF